MTKSTNTIAIHDVLTQLGVQTENAGTSTGSQWFSTGEFIASHSPVDGALIGKYPSPRQRITVKLWTPRRVPLSNGVLCLHLSAEK